MSGKSKDMDDLGMDRMQALMSTYYGMGSGAASLSSSPVDEESTVGSSGSKRGISSSSSNTTSSRFKNQDKRNIDSSAFSSEVYVKDLLKTMSLTRLLKYNEEVMREIHQLDSDMQSLVYGNYSKFISATDAIRKMKGNVESMKNEMNHVMNKMEELTSKSSAVNGRLASRQNNVEQLVGVRKLLKKLDFLFQLPSELKSAIDMREYSKAAKYFTIAVKSLTKYSHLLSFATIQAEAETIIQNMVEILKKEFQNESSTSDMLGEYSSILLSLGQSSDSICKMFITWHKTKLEAILENVILQAKSTDISSLTSFFEDACKNLLRPLSVFIDKYQKIFICGDDKTDEITKELVSLVKSITNLYNQNCASLLQQQVGSNLTEISFEARKEAFTSYMGILSRFVSDASVIDTLLPQSHMNDRVAEIVEKSIRFHITQSFTLLKKRSMQQLEKYHAKAQTALYDETESSDVASDCSLYQISKNMHVELIHMIEAMLEGIKPLVNTGTLLLLEMNRVFAALIQTQFHDYMMWYISAIEVYSNSTDHLFKNTDMKEDHSINGFHVCECNEIMIPYLLPHPSFVFVLSHVCNELFVKGISQCTHKMSTCLPSLSRIDELDGSNVDANANLFNLHEKSKQTSLTLLKYLAELFGQQLSHIIRVGLQNTNWMETREPRDVHSMIESFIEELATIAKKVAHMIKEEAVGSFATANHGGRNRDFRQLSGRQTSFSNVGLQLDVDRIFSKKIQVRSMVEFKLETLLSCILRIAFKSYLEDIRVLSFSKGGFQQVQIDLNFLSTILSMFVEDSSTLEIMLKDIFSSAYERSKDPTKMEQSVIVAIVSTKKGKLRLKY